MRAKAGGGVICCRLALIWALAAAAISTFQQRITGHAIGAVQPGERRLTHSVQPFQIGFTCQIGYHSAAGVMRRWHHGQWFASHIEAVFAAFGVNVGKWLRIESAD